MGVGMCFCLRRANRLIPNRFSFPLVDRGERRGRGFHDLGAEEEGLLSHYSDDMEDEDDAEAIDNQNALQSSGQADDAEENEDFGLLQSHDNTTSVSNENEQEADNEPNKGTV
ncbi:hypothetical protein BD408DRAFT_413614 [Parasitella parasitica]|nr:hypothetical protein BD408DRAFT_413614 [Parasitella parasitica]